MSITDYLYRFSHLRTDVNHHRWTPATIYRAPHKPLLLLTILDQIAQGTKQVNLFEFTPELGDQFARYWSLLMPINRRGNMALPFFHLRSSGFWHLLPVPGQEKALESIRQVDTLSQLQKLVLGAKVDEDLFSLCQIEETRDALRMTLIQTYFAPEYQALLLNQGAISLNAYLYSQQLIEKVRYQLMEKSGVEEEYNETTRDQGFRRAVVRLYDHRCAFCGVRMLTVDGHSVVDAAHIIPWSINHNDDPRNGMALCRLCHWTFDEGLASVSVKYTMLLSSELRTSLNVPGHLLTLENRPIIGPVEEAFMPDPASLSWHRQKIFRAQ